MIKEISLTDPKSRTAALNQAVYCSSMQDNWKRKENTLMEQKSLASAKILRLQKQLQSYEDQLSEIPKNTENFQQAIEQLKERWNLTNAEILETKSELLRKQISRLEAQKAAGIVTD